MSSRRGRRDARRAEVLGRATKVWCEELENRVLLSTTFANVLVNDMSSDTTSRDTQSETSTIAFGSTVLASFNDSGSNAVNSSKFTGWARSTDGGKTFTDMGALPTNTNGDAGDPVLARDNTTGAVYFATLSIGAANVIQIFKSTDGGVTFGAPVNGDPGFTGGSLDKEWLAVDNYAGSGQGNVYLIVRDFGTKNGIFVTRSTDGGATWGPSGGVAITTGSSTQGAWVTVGPDHAVYAFWYDAQTSPQRIMMRKSTDQGLTFSSPVVVANLLTTGSNGDLGLGFRTNTFPQAVVNPTNPNNVYVTFDDNPAGTDRGDIYFTQSNNGGTTWSTPVRVNDDATTRDQWQPALAIKPNGSQLFIGFYDRRNDAANALIDTYGAVASISGNTVTFQPNFRITDTAFGSVYGVDPAINSVYMGDYDSAAADNSGFYYTWADNRDNSLGRTGKQANVRFAKISTSMQVATTTPAANAVLATAPTDFTVDFTDAYTPASVDASDFTVNGVAADSFAAVDADTVTFHFNTSPVTTQGLQTMAIAGGAITRTSDGSPIDAFSATFRYDVTAMQVASTVPANGAGVVLPLSNIDVTFNEAYDPSSIGASDLVLSQGAVTGATAVNSTTVRYAVSGLTAEGVVTVSMAAGAVSDAFGNPMQAYAGSFTTDVGTVPFPTPMASRVPQGAVVYTSQTPSTNVIGPAGDADSFTLNLDAGQTLTVIISPAASLQPSVEVRDPSNNVVGGAVAVGPGKYALVQAVPVVSAGTYTITVSGAGSTTGTYGAQAMVNAAAEAELYGGAANDTQATAQDLGGSFTPLGGGASRAAVSGQLPLGAGVPLVGDDFESGVLSGAWTKYSSDASLGRIQVSGAYGTGGGSYALLMDHNDSGGATYNLNEAVWTVNLSGLTQATLTFSQASYNDEADTLAASFVGHANGDGVSISADGNTWYRVWQGPTGTGTYGTVTVDLGAAATAAGIPLGANFKIKFQQYDNYNLTTDGRGFDNVLITTPSPNVDWYSFPLAAGDSATVALKALGTGSAAEVKLFDSAGNLLAIAAPGATNVDRVLTDFVAPAAGTYYVQLTGNAGDYTLVVTRNSEFDTETNDTIAAAQQVRSRQTGGTQTVLGNIGGTATTLLDLSPLVGQPVDELEVQGVRFGFIVENDPAGPATVEGPPAELESLSGTPVISGNAAGRLTMSFDQPASRVEFRVGLIFPEGEPVPGGGEEEEESVVLASLYDEQGGLVGVQQIRPDPLDHPDSWESTFRYQGAAISRIVLDFDQDADVEFALGGMAVTTGNVTDTYAVALAAGATLNVQTSTPNDGAGEPVNNFNPRLRLLGPTGTQLAVDDNSAPDGRNALLSFTAASAGTYYVEVSSTTASSTIGDYVLSVSGGNAPAGTFSVSATNPPNGGSVVSATQMVVDFSDSVQFGSLQASDLVFDGVPLSSYSVVDANTATFTLPTGLGNGTHTFSFAAGSVTDVHGNPLQAMSGSFSIDNLPPTVVASSVQQGDVLGTGALTYTVTFSKAMLVGNLDASDVTLLGTLRNVSYAATSLSYSPDGRTLTVKYANLPEDSYTLTLLSGNGRFEGSTGVDLDGEPAWPIPPAHSGDGVEGGNFFVNFSVDVGSSAYPNVLPVDPRGSMVYDPVVGGAIGAGGDADSFTLALNAGQTLTAVVDPSAGLIPTLTVRDPSNAVVATVTSAGANLDAVAQLVPITSAGTYTITVSGSGGTSGLYNLQAFLNAAVEADAHDGASNSTLATAQDVDPAMAPVGGPASRGAVVGRLNAADDWYKFTLAAGDAATIGLTSLSAGTLKLELRDSSNTLLALGGAVSGLGQGISGFVAPAGGTYYVHVTGTLNADYNLTVNRNLDFDTEVNDTIAAAQPLVAGRAAGYAGVGASTIESFEDGDLKEYTFLSTNNASVTASAAHDGNFGLQLGDSTEWMYRNDAAAQVSRGMTFSAWVRAGAGSGRAYFGFGASSGGCLSLVMAVNTGEFVIQNNAGYSFNPLATVPQTWVANKFYRMEVTWQVSGTIIGRLYDSDGSTLLNTVQATDTTISAGGLAFRGFGTTYNIDSIAAGAGGSAGVDVYAVSAAAGATLQLSTATPGAGPLQPGNSFDPRIRVLDGSGTVLASDDNSGSDGRNAALTFPVPSAGTYYVEVGSSPLVATGGEYVLSATGGNPILASFGVTSTSIPDGSVLTTVPAQITVDFGQSVLFSSLQASDLKVDGVAATAFTIVDNNTVAFTLPPLVSGKHNVSIAAGALSDIQEVAVQPFASSFTLDVGGPQVVASSILDGESRQPGTLGYTVTFSKPLRVANLDSTDFTLHGVTKNINYTSSSFGYDASGTVLVLNYSSLPEDNYTLTLLSGDGRFEDAAGVDLDGSPSFPLPSGDGVAGGNFVVNFSLDTAATAFPTPLVSRLPQGGQAYEGTTSGQLNTATDVDGYTLAVEAGHTLAVYAHPTTATLRPVVELRDSSNALVATATAPAAGQDALIQATALTGGTYTIRVSDAAGATGSFTLTADVNAAVEAEEHGGAADDVRATAQDVNGAFTPIAAGVSRAAVVGRLPATSNDDWYAFTLPAGTTLSLAAKFTLSPTLGAIKLMDGSGNLMALGSNGPTNSDRVITDVAITGAGTYYAVVSGNTNSDYTLLLTKNAEFETEANDATSTAQPVIVPAQGGAQWVTGYLSSGVDLYAVTLPALGTLGVQTFTPGDGFGEPANTFNPRLRILNSAGTQVAIDDNSAADAKNAVINFTAFSAGTYYVEVSSTTAAVTSGDYLLSISGNTPAAAAAFTVQGTNPNSGAISKTAPATIAVTFNRPVMFTSMTAGSLTIDGVPCTALTVVDARNVTFTLPAGVGGGAHTFAMAAGSATDLQGVPLQAFSGTFTVDNVAPRVVASSVSENDSLPAGPLTYTVTFSEAMKKANLDSTDFTLKGVLKNVFYTATAFSYDTAGAVLTLTYGALPEDSYVLTLLSADGRFEDGAGNDLDGSPSFPLPSGDGVEGGNFVVDFTTDVPTAAFPTPLTSKPPLGGLIYDPTASGLIGTAGDTDGFTLGVDPGQTLTVVVSAPSSALRPSVDVLDPSNNVVASASAAAAGQEAVVQTLAIPVGGTYTIRVSGAGGTTGAYTVQAILNAAVENEEHFGATDDTVATAQDLGGSFISLGGSASRGAVVGKLPSASGNDYYSFTAAAGDAVTLAVARQGGTGGETIALVDAASNVLATGVTGAVNVDQSISNFVFATGGTYYVRVSGSGSAVYDLLVNRNAAFDLENNNTLATAGDLGSSTAVNGYVGAGLSAGGGTGTPITPPVDVIGANLAIGFAADGSLTGPTIGARDNGVEYIRWGTFLAGFTVGINGATYTNGTAGGNGTAFPITMQDLSSGAQHVIKINGTLAGGVGFQRVVQWTDGNHYALFTTTLTNNTASALSNVAMLDNDDPDPGNVVSTNNDVTSGGDLVVGSGAAGAMGVGSADPRRVTSAEGFFISNPFDVISSPVDPNGAIADVAINMAFNIGSLAPGLSATTTFAMVFGATQAAVEGTYGSISGLTTAAAADDDYYSFTLAAGDSVQVSTSTPGDGPNQFVNSLNPKIELYDPTNALVASDDNGAPDGRNAMLTYVASQAGTYRVHVAAAGSTAGEYVLTVGRATSGVATPSKPDLLDGSDSGVSATDDLTNRNNSSPARSLQFSVGNTMAGATVTIYANGVPIGSASSVGGVTVVTTDGSTTVADGVVSFTARQTLGGKLSSPSVALSVTVDGVAPAAPAAPDLQAASDSGASNSDNVTNVTSPTFNISATPYFRFFRDGVQVSGDYETGGSYALPPQADGTYAYAVSAVDAAGNASAAGASLGVTIDTVAPAAPVAPDLQAGSDSGVSASDDLTNSRSPKFDVAAGEPGVIHLMTDGVLGTGTSLVVGGAGTYTLGLSTLASGFLPQQTYGTGAITVMVTAGDLNGDGYSDLVAGVNNSSLAVFLGSAAGTFNTGTTIRTSANPEDLGLADFNGDHKLDLAVRLSSTLLVFAGNGDGTFQSPQSLTTGSGFYLRLDDLNGDGNTDVALGESSQISVFLGKGDGTFQPRKTSTSGVTAYQVKSADMDGDGKMDLYSGTTTTGVAVYLGNGDGTFKSGTLTNLGGSNVVGSAAADLNSDGKLDLVAVDNGSHNLYVLLGNGNGTFQAPVTRAVTGGGQVAVRDFNGDGKLDVAVTGSTDGAVVSLFLGNGDGTLQAATTYSVGTSPWGITAGDFNNDGSLDVAVGNRTGNSVSVLVANFNGLADGAHAFTAWAEDLAGNKSAMSAPLSVTLDTVAPAATSAPDLDAASDDGGDSADNLTSVNTPAFAVGGAAPYFRLYRNGALASGPYESANPYALPAQSTGTWSYSATAVDAAGNESASSSALRVTIVSASPGSAFQLTGISSTPTLTVTAGNVGVAGDLSTAYPGVSLGVSGGASVQFSSAEHFASFTLSGGSTATAGGALTIGTLSIDGTSVLDLGSNDLLVDRAATPPSMILSYLSGGYAGNTWGGAGIRSSLAAADASHFSLGYADGGVTSIAPPGKVLVRYTRRGDANLDGKVDIQDLLIFRSNSGATTGAQWWQADFTYDGKVDIQDLLALRANTGMSVSVGSSSPAEPPLSDGQDDGQKKLFPSEDGL